MFQINKGNRIVLTKGDTASMLIEVVDVLGNKYDIKSTDVITMTVKKSGSTQAAITKTATADHYIILNPEDTSNLQGGLYYYDIQLTTSSGSIYTIVPKSFFELTEEVSI